MSVAQHAKRFDSFPTFSSVPMGTAGNNCQRFICDLQRFEAQPPGTYVIASGVEIQARCDGAPSVEQRVE